MTNDDDERLTPMDPRVAFAAERTLLAWVRTGLALMGFGFVVARFGLFLREIATAPGGRGEAGSGPSLWIGAALVIMGVIVNILAAVKYVRLIRGLERGEPYRPTVWSLEVIVTAVLALFGVVMTVCLLSWSR